ncbi:MAG: ChaN family lipoprotein [Nitrospirae bacterium]|nr:ChaN family lipoprotein [Nitrospirota bacterium]
MRTLKTIIAFLVLLFVSSAAIASAAADVTDYKLDVSIDARNSQLSGIARISAKTGRDILLNKGTLEINYVKLNDKRIDIHDSDRAVKITPDKNGTLEISYKKIFKNTPSSHDGPAGTSQSVIAEGGVSLTGTWYPEIEGLNYYKLKAVLPKGYEALSEAEEIIKIEKADTVEFYFSFPYPLDGINLTASNKFKVKKDNYRHVEICAYFFPEDLKLAETYIEFTKKYLKLYEGLIGKYPYRRFSIVENFLPTGYSMPTFTLLGSAVVRLPFIVETSLGHEILHQWFGNLVYIDYEKGNWAEGLTTYLADHLYEEQKGRGWEYRKQVLTNYKSYVSAEKDFPLNNFISRSDPTSQAIGYGKAAMVFHMLKNITGEKAFYDSLKHFIKENSFRAASWEDLGKSFGKTSGSNLDLFFAQWTREKGLPEIEINNIQSTQAGSGFELSFDVNRKTDAFMFTLPTNIYLKSSVIRKSLEINKKQNSFKFALPERPVKIVFDEDYDVARDIGRDEFPPVIARLLAEDKPVIAVPLKDEDIYKSVIAGFIKQEAAKKNPNDIKEQDIKSSSIVILGIDNPLIGRLFGKIPPVKEGFAVLVKENPLNPQKVVGIFYGRTKAEVDAAFGKISHYGKYSMLTFENGKNIKKEIAQTERGIVMELKDDAAVVDLSTLKKLSDVVNGAADKKIIYVGEVHDVFAHHAVQLDIITGLHDKNKKIAIGMEMFQRPFQKTLDSFIGGKMTEADFLRQSEYFKRWGFDYNLYKPILDFAREKKLPVVALNMEREIIEKVSKKGVDSLTSEEKKMLPREMDLTDGEYRDRLKDIFAQHKNEKDANFDFFYMSQLLWDETMSQSINTFLKEKPDYQMVALAGKGHIEYGSGIPKRTFRRNGYGYSIVLIDAEVEKGIADYVIFPKSVEGVTSPKLMVFVDEENGILKITGFPEKSVSEKAGLKAGDIIISIDGITVKSVEDIKIHLLYKKTGETVKVKAQRKEKEEEKKMDFDVVL